jgi:hypothetical protein
VYNDIGIGAFGKAEQRATDSLVQDAVESGFVIRGGLEEISP